MPKKRAKNQAKFKSKIKAKAEKAIEKTIKAQIYQLDQPKFVKMLCVIAQLPFSTTEEILTLSGGLNDGLSLNRTQIYLRQAVDWGWLKCVNYYRGSKEVSELNSVATSGLTCLFYSPNLPLECKIEEEYFESLTKRAAASKAPIRRMRHFYLTPIGAKILAQIVQLYQRESQSEFECRVLHKWQNEFVELLGFKEHEVLCYAGRLEGLYLFRQFLLNLTKNLCGEDKMANSPIAFSWQDCGVMGPKIYSINSFDTHLWNYFDGFVSIGKAQLLILADTEQLPPAWILSYLKKVYCELKDLPSLQAALNSFMKMAYTWDTRRLEEFLDNLSERKELIMKQSSNLEIRSSADNPAMKIVILTRSRARAILWREAFSRVPVSIEVEEALTASFFQFSVIPADELDEKAAVIVETSVRGNINLVDNNNKYDVNRELISSQMAYYLKKIYSNQTEIDKELSDIYYPIDFLPENIEFSVTPLSSFKALTFEKNLLFDLLEQPSKRRLLFTLHTYSLFDALACSRLTGIEMTHLRLHLEQLQKAGLIARFWGLDASKCRTWSRWNESGTNEELVDDNQNRTKFTFCTLPFQSVGQAQAPLLSDTGRQRYQDYGELSYFTSMRATELPFAMERDRLKRYYYFITEKGLLALLWLEGFPLIFEPRYRSELARLARIRREIEASERKLIVLEASCSELNYTRSLFSDGRISTEFSTQAAEVESRVGFSWPSLLTEHISGVTNFFLSFPSRHFSVPFRTTPGIYPVTKKHQVEKLLHEKAGQVRDYKERRQPLFKGVIKIALESWQTEPLCHRYYVLPKRLATAGYDSPYSYVPNFGTLKLEVGGERGECLPDGYGEFIIERFSGVYEPAVVYLELERGQRNWTERYKGKISAYLQLFWSEWLLQSIKARQPLLQVSTVPKYLLLVASDASQEQKLLELFKVTTWNVLYQLLNEAPYNGYGPNGACNIGGESEQKHSVILALLHGLHLQILTTNQELLNSFGVLAPIWQWI